MTGRLSKEMVPGLELKRKDDPRKSRRAWFEGGHRLLLVMGWKDITA